MLAARHVTCIHQRQAVRPPQRIATVRHAVGRPVLRKLTAVEGDGAAATVSQVSAPPAGAAPPITLTEKALAQLHKLRAETMAKSPDSGALLLRVGVKSGGCSGMSYVMDFEKREQVGSDDMVVPYDNGNFELVINPKSLLYLFGMSLDYSDALIGGGFQFQNPNATDSCGCGKSFGV